MKTVLPSIVLERHQTCLGYIVLGALYLIQPENQATSLLERTDDLHLLILTRVDPVT